MKLPRPRMTVRRMMLLVAAFALIVLVPVSTRLSWLQKAPLSINLVGGSIGPRDPSSTRGAFLIRGATVGKAVPIPCFYEVGISDSIPSGLIYKILIDVKVVNDATRKVEQTCQRRHTLVAGWDNKLVQRGFNCNFTPRRTGSYTIRYEIHTSDMLGRKAMTAFTQHGFTVN